MFTDAKSRYSTIYFSHRKDGVLDHFRDYTALVETQTGNHLKWLQSDGGSKYVNTAFKAFYSGKGIVMEFTAPYSPVQNGITKWLNCTLLQHAHTMMFANRSSSCFGWRPLHMLATLRTNPQLRHWGQTSHRIKDFLVRSQRLTDWLSLAENAGSKSLTSSTLNWNQSQSNIFSLVCLPTLRLGGTTTPCPTMSRCLEISF